MPDYRDGDPADPHWWRRPETDEFGARAARVFGRLVNLTVLAIGARLVSPDVPHGVGIFMIGCALIWTIEERRDP